MNTPISHLKSILTLPFNAIVIIPLIILYLTNDYATRDLGLLNVSIGVLLVSTGLIILSITIASFNSIGKGTLAPWDPPKELVTNGMYKYMRHPMISGVILSIIGESLLVQSGSILIYGIFFTLLNVIYLKYVEEPELVKRFGNQYITYKRNVPGFIFRWKTNKT